MANDPVKDLITGMGAMAEMAHSFHDAMVRSGASEREATAAMNSFISAFWHESMEDARRKKKMEAQGNDKAYIEAAQ